MIFPDPHSFDPDRWIRAAKARQPLSKYLVNFTRGSRSCLGVQLVGILNFGALAPMGSGGSLILFTRLAVTEVFATLSRVVTTFDMELYETTVSDVGMDYVRGIGYPRKPKGPRNQRGQVIVKVNGRIAETRNSICLGKRHVCSFVS